MTLERCFLALDIGRFSAAGCAGGPRSPCVRPASHDDDVWRPPNPDGTDLYPTVRPGHPRQLHVRYKRHDLGRRIRLLQRPPERLRTLEPLELEVTAGEKARRLEAFDARKPYLLRRPRPAQSAPRNAAFSRSYRRLAPIQIHYPTPGLDADAAHDPDCGLRPGRSLRVRQGRHDLRHGVRRGR